MGLVVYKDESYAIIGACMRAHSKLGCGFLEAVYQEALVLELSKRSIPFEKEKPLHIYYDNIKLCQHYFADFVCYDKIIIELKALSKTSSIEEAQVLNYLKITGYKLGLLINFGRPSLEYQRILL